MLGVPRQLGRQMRRQALLPASSSFSSPTHLTSSPCRCFCSSSCALEGSHPVASNSSSSASTPTSPTPSRSDARARSRAARFAPRPGADMVGPPDPISNLRPMRYGSAFEEDIDGLPESREKGSAGMAESLRREAMDRQQQQTRAIHPYSLSEFSSLATSSSPSDKTKRSARKPHTAYFNRLLERLEAAELEHKLRRVRSDIFHERFWTDNNHRFQGSLKEFQQESATGSSTALSGLSDTQSNASATTTKDGPLATEGSSTTQALRRPSSPRTTTPKSDSLAPFYSAWLSANSSRHKAYNRALIGGLFKNLGPAYRYETLRWWAGVVRRVERALGRGA